MPSLTLTDDIKPGSELHRKIVNEVRFRVQFSDRKFISKREKWREADDAMVAYVPSSEADTVRANKRKEQGKPAYTTIKIPYSYGVAMSLHAYLVAVFLSRSPVFQFEGLHGEGEQQIMALEALHHYQYKIGMMGPEFFSWLYDCVKYGVGCVGDYWQKTIRAVCEIVPQIDPNTGEVVGYEQVTERVLGYTGNTLFLVPPYDMIPDPRVALRNVQKGEFFGTRQRLSWQTVKERQAQGYYTNVDKIDPHILPNFPTDRDRDTDSRSIERPTEDLYDIGTMSFNDGDEARTPHVVPVYEMFMNIVPSEYRLDNSDYPCKWVFTVTADFKTVIGAAPFGARHTEFPYNVLEMEMDANALVNRGIMEITGDLNNTLDWLFNSRQYNVRASLNNLFVVDPQRIVTKDVTNPLPGGLIRRRPGISTSGDTGIEQLRIQDVTGSNVSDMQLVNFIGEQTHGIGPILQGASTPGTRKTATQARGELASGTSRAKIIAEYMSCSGIATLGRHMVANSQQYYDASMKLRIVGSLAELAGPRFMQVDPSSISGHYDFMPVDGALPLDRFAQLNTWKEIMFGMGKFPALLMQYDVGKIFAWVAQLGGIRNLNNFRIQPTEQGLLQQQLQQGDVVPLGENSNPDNLEQPSQLGPINVGSGISTGVG